MPSFKLAVFVPNQVAPSYNGVRFETTEMADDAGADLLRRWLMAERYEVEPSEDEPNRFAERPVESGASIAAD